MLNTDHKSECDFLIRASVIRLFISEQDTALYYFITRGLTGKMYFLLIKTVALE